MNRATSYEPSFMQTALNDNVLNVIEHPLHVIFVRGACTVRIDVLLGQIPVFVLELLLNEFIAFIKVGGGPGVFRKALGQRFPLNLFLK